MFLWSYNQQCNCSYYLFWNTDCNKWKHFPESHIKLQKAEMLKQTLEICSKMPLWKIIYWNKQKIVKLTKKTPTNPNPKPKTNPYTWIYIQIASPPTSFSPHTSHRSFSGVWGFSFSRLIKNGLVSSIPCSRTKEERFASRRRSWEESEERP